MENEDNLIYLNLLQVKVAKQFPSSVEKLLNICILKLNELKKHYFSEYYLLVLDPLFMLQVLNEYISHLSTLKQDDHHSVFEILKILVQCCPGLEDALFMLAKLQFIQGDINNALINLQKLLKNSVDPRSEAYLLMAQINIQQGFYERAAHNLEVSYLHNIPS